MPPEDPFLLFLHLYEPHTPYEPPAPFRERYEDPYDGEVAASDEVVDVQIVVDTGMHRVGVAPERAVDLARQVADAPSIRLTGMWTHFAVAEDDEAFSRLQIERFESVADQVTPRTRPVAERRQLLPQRAIAAAAMPQTT